MHSVDVSFAGRRVPVIGTFDATRPRARAAFLERFSEGALVEDFRGILAGVLAPRARMRGHDANKGE